MTPDNLKVVCEYRAKDPKSPTDFAMEAIEIVEKQRGIWNKNIITWKVINETDDIEKARDLRYAMNIGFTEWDIEVPLIMIEAADGEEADITINFRHAKDDPYYPNSTSVLAYAGFPDGALKGIIVFFDDWDWNLHGKTGYNVIAVLIHELGHTWGLGHATQHLDREPNMMDPFYRKELIELSRYDIQRIVAAYGARVYANSEQHDRLENANRRQKKRLIEDAV